jgi:hypothetical protein
MHGYDAILQPSGVLHQLSFTVFADEDASGFVSYVNA